MSDHDSAGAALVVAHPGHEVTLHGWLEDVRPVVFVLTDGSGQSGVSRLSSTGRVLQAAGARQGAVYGRMTDAAMYAAVLDGDVATLWAIAQELADSLADDDVEYVVTDAAEGYNPTHDVCRTIAGVAVALAGRQGRERPLYEYVVTGDREPCVAGRCLRSRRRSLSDDSRARKLTAVNTPSSPARRVRPSSGTAGTRSSMHRRPSPAPARRPRADGDLRAAAHGTDHELHARDSFRHGALRA